MAVEGIMEVINAIIGNWDSFAEAAAYLIAAASIIVKITPTLKDDNMLKEVLKFLSKIGLNRTITSEEQKAVNKK